MVLLKMSVWWACIVCVGERQYAHKQCEQWFTQAYVSSLLTLALYVNVGERRCTCKQCDKRFAQAYCLSVDTLAACMPGWATVPRSAVGSAWEAVYTSQAYIVYLFVYYILYLSVYTRSRRPCLRSQNVGCITGSVLFLDNLRKTHFNGWILD